MAQLTNKQYREINVTLYHLTRAFNYLFSDDVVICRISKYHSNSEQFTRAKDNICLTVVTKEYGSDLTGLHEGIERIQNFIDMHSKY